MHFSIQTLSQGLANHVRRPDDADRCRQDISVRQRGHAGKQPPEHVQRSAKSSRHDTFSVTLVQVYAVLILLTPQTTIEISAQDTMLLHSIGANARCFGVHESIYRY